MSVRNTILIAMENLPETSTHLELNFDEQNRKWAIKSSNLGGRGLFAIKSIKQGSLIFSNKRLVVGPRADSLETSYCSHCYLISDDCYACEKCALLICSPNCATSSGHIKECAFISEHWKSRDCNSVKNRKILSEMLIYLCCLLLTEEQMQLFSLLQRHKNLHSFKELEILCTEYEIPEEHQKYIRIINSVMKINSFRISRNCLKNTIPLRGIYPLASFLNHSCIPNTRNIFNNDYTMNVYASRDIEIGEEILTCYTGILWCTPARRCQLYKTKQFWCKCDRCNDATEMGTKLSALKCLNRECVGVLLPSKPTDINTTWRCDNCDKLVPHKQVGLVQSVLGSLVGALHIDDEFRLEASLMERLSHFIPFSNHIFVDLRFRLLLKIGFTEGLKLNELSESRLALKESLCRGMVRTLAALGAGDAHLRGLLLYHLHAVLAERARRSPDQYEDLKSEIENTIAQAYNILQGDMSAPPDLELRHRYLGPGCDKSHEERFFILDS